MRLSATTLAVLALLVPAASAGTEENERPRLKVVSMYKLASRVHATLRICDDAARNVVIFARETRRGVPSYTRRFTTTTPPSPCVTYRRSWTPAPRFLAGGGYVVTVWARDAGGLTSLRRQVTFLR